MSLSQEQAAFLLDACKLIQHATEQGFMVTGGSCPARLNSKPFISKRAGRRP